MPTVLSKILIAFTVALILQTVAIGADFDQQILAGLNVSVSDIKDCIARKPPKDTVGELYGIVYFKHHAGVCMEIFDYIVDELAFDVTEARNIHFKYTDEENYYRKRNKCKISVDNRILCFLHTMKEGDTVWEAAKDNNWNISSVSMDFFHVLIKFVDTFESTWITPMTDEYKDNMTFPGYSPAYQAADGSHFHRRKSKILPGDLRRRELYLYKHKYPEGQNVQAVVNYFGVATEVVTGIPGGMPDSSASEYICQNDRYKSTLVDSGYPGSRPQFWRCDGTPEHAAQRTVVERYFGRLKLQWKMVGSKYCRSARFHSYCIRAAFILTNMQILFAAGLNH